jgi:urease accessory protein
MEHDGNDAHVRPVRFGIGGPVGSGKSHLLLRLCQRLGSEHSIIAITNDIYSREDERFLVRAGALAEGRILGVETGGCPHAAIRDDISVNADALARLQDRFGDTRLAFIESGGDNLAASFSPDLVDYQIYVIDVAQGGDIPRKGGLGITRSDLLVVNKVDLAPFVEVDLQRMTDDVRAARGDLPFVMTNLKDGTGVEEVAAWIVAALGAPRRDRPAWGVGGHHHHHHGNGNGFHSHHHHAGHAEPHLHADHAR